MGSRLARRWTGVLGALLATFVVGTSVAAATPYTDPQNRFSLTVPDGWQVAPRPANAPPAILVVLNAPAPLNGTVNVVATSVPAGATLDDAVAGISASTSNALPGFQPSGGVQKLTLGGQPAARYDYSFMLSGTRARGAQVISLVGNVGYILTFTAAEGDFDTVLQQGALILTSWSFLGAAGTPPPAPAMPLPATGHARAQASQTPSISVILAACGAIAAGMVLRRRTGPIRQAVS
jgi:hypothetical protein